MERKVYSNTFEFLSEVFDRSAEFLMAECNGQRQLNVLIDPPQDYLNGSMVWMHKAAVIKIPNNYKRPNSQFALSVIMRNAFEHDDLWEFNISDQALLNHMYLEDLAKPEQFLLSMPKDSKGASQGLGLGLYGKVGSGELYLADEVNPNQFADNEVNRPILSILKGMRTLAKAINTPPVKERINNPAVMGCCLSYVDLLKERSIATAASLKKHNLDF